MHMNVIHESCRYIRNQLNTLLTFIGARLFLLALGSRIVAAGKLARSQRTHAVASRWFQRNFIQIGKGAGPYQPEIAHPHLENMFGETSLLHFECQRQLFEFVIEN